MTENNYNWDKLVEEFIKWNSQINLSAIRDEEGIKIKHIEDSLRLNKHFQLKPGSKVVDLGTGGGFPLLPLAITNPEVTFNGIEARKKKVTAVNDIITNLGIENAKVTWTRAEDFKGQFDYLTARAVGYIDKLMKWGNHLVKKGGYFLLYKPDSTEEYDEILRMCDRYKLDIENVHFYKLFEEDIQRVLYIIKKL